MRVKVWKVKHIALGDVAAPEAVFFDEEQALESVRVLKEQGRPVFLYVNEVEEGTSVWSVPSGIGPAEGWANLL